MFHVKMSFKTLEALLLENLRLFFTNVQVLSEIYLVREKNVEISEKEVNNEVKCDTGKCDASGQTVPEGGSLAKIFDVNDSQSFYDKYSLELHLRHKHKDLLAFAKGNRNFDAWNAQIPGKFGYIPLSNHKIPDTDKNVKFQGNLIELHNKIWHSKQHYFMGEQIVIPSQFNIEVWDKEFNIKLTRDNNLLTHEI